MKDLKAHIGTLVRNNRNQMGIPQTKLAEEIGISDAMVGQIERGESCPSVETLQKLIAYLDIDPREVFCESQEPDKFCYEMEALMQRMSLLQKKQIILIARILLQSKF